MYHIDMNEHYVVGHNVDIKTNDINLSTLRGALRQFWYNFVAKSRNESLLVFLLDFIRFNGRELVDSPIKLKLMKIQTDSRFAFFDFRSRFLLIMTRIL